MRFFYTVLQFFVVLILAGCGAPAKKAAPPPPVHRVGIVSLLPTELSYQKFGITKFNNERTSRPVGDVFNDAARAGAQSALRLSDRSVIQLSVDAPRLARHVQDYPGALDRKIEQLEDDLLPLVAEHKLDAIVVVIENIEKGKPINGIRVVVRAGMGYITKTEAMPHITMLSLDRNIKVVSMSQVTSSYPANRASDEPWVYTLAENLNAATHDQLTKLMQNAIQSEVEQGVMSLNF